MGKRWSSLVNVVAKGWSSLADIVKRLSNSIDISGSGSSLTDVVEMARDYQAR